LAFIVEKKPTAYSHHESERPEPQNPSDKKGRGDDDAEQIDLEEYIIEECISNAGSL
tara:strand:+ start:299 stop:469 length:171 start_codon:yes stop_codon:yes gene_type:complete